MATSSVTVLVAGLPLSFVNHTYYSTTDVVDMVERTILQYIKVAKEINAKGTRRIKTIEIKYTSAKNPEAWEWEYSRADKATLMVKRQGAYFENDLAKLVAAETQELPKDIVTGFVRKVTWILKHDVFDNKNLGPATIKAREHLIGKGHWPKEHEWCGLPLLEDIMTLCFVAPGAKMRFFDTIRDRMAKDTEELVGRVLEG